MFSGHFQFSIPFGKDGQFPAVQLVYRGNETNGAVQTDVVVVVHEAANQAPGILDIERRARSNGLGFNRSVPALDLPIERRRGQGSSGC